MKTRFFILYIFLIITATAVSQTGGAKGRVVNTNGIPISNANVVLENTAKGTYTKTNGFFKLSGLKTGNKVLLISNVGYKSTKVEIYVIADETIEIPDITLISKTENLDKVILNSEEKNKYVQKIPSKSLRLNTKLIELPQNIQIVSEELIRDQISFSLFDGISRNVSGTRRGMHQTYAQIYMRGYRVQGLRNGMNIRGYFGPMKDDISFVERFEYVKGPAGFMIGNTSLGGLYNVVTKKPNGSGKKSIAVILGSFDTYRVELDVDGKLSKDKKLLYRLNLMGKLQGSHTDYGYENGYVITPSIRYSVSDSSQITLEYIYQNNYINN